MEKSLKEQIHLSFLVAPFVAIFSLSYGWLISDPEAWNKIDLFIKLHNPAGISKLISYLAAGSIAIVAVGVLIQVFSRACITMGVVIYNWFYKEPFDFDADIPKDAFELMVTKLGLATTHENLDRLHHVIAATFHHTKTTKNLLDWGNRRYGDRYLYLNCAGALVIAHIIGHCFLGFRINSWFAIDSIIFLLLVLEIRRAHQYLMKMVELFARLDETKETKGGS
jgi:hypothetical protein